MRLQGASRSQPEYWLRRGAVAAGYGVSLQILLMLTVLTLAPAILIMMTSFTRIIIVLSFVRSALATQQMPPNPGVDRVSNVFDFFHHVALFF